MFPLHCLQIGNGEVDGPQQLPPGYTKLGHLFVHFYHWRKTRMTLLCLCVCVCVCVHQFFFSPWEVVCIQLHIPIVHIISPLFNAYLFSNHQPSLEVKSTSILRLLIVFFSHWKQKAVSLLGQVLVCDEKPLTPPFVTLPLFLFLACCGFPLTITARPSCFRCLFLMSSHSADNRPGPPVSRWLSLPVRT